MKLAQGTLLTIKKIVASAFLGAIVFFIFFQSLQTATQSSQASSHIVSFLQTIFDLLGISFIVKEEPIRILAHFGEFLLLGILVAINIVVYRKPQLSQMFVSLMVFMPVLDEALQSFVPGRAFEISDLIVDYCGVLLGVMLIVFIQKIRLNKQKNKEQH